VLGPMPDGYTCPLCGVDQSHFKPEQE
jgi:rubredoxin